jgi:predicted RNase H-like nuclease
VTSEVVASPDITGEKRARVDRRSGMRVTGVDACRGGWVAVSLEASPAQTSSAPAGPAVTVTSGGCLAALLAPERSAVVGIDMPLGLLETGWRNADRAARGLLGPRRSSVFAIPPRAVWAESSYRAANQRCRELTGQGFSIQAWGLRAKLLEANQYRETCGHPLYEVHPELAFGALAGAPLAASKHTGAGRDLRRELLARAGIEIPGGHPAALFGDILDAAAVAWSARRIAAGQAVTIPSVPQRDGQDREISIRY